MRVIGGRLGGQRIDAPSGMDTRPTLDRVREALFNVLQAEVSGARVLDLYAGTGALAIEALSRGAVSAVLVECSERARRVIRKNVTRLGLETEASLVAERAERAVGSFAPGTFDLALLDPPWPAGVAAPVLERLPALMAEGGIVVVEHERIHGPQAVGVESWPGLTLVDRRRYGRTGLSFFRRQQEHPT